MTGGRIKALKGVVGDSTFMVTYGDGLADIDLRALVEFHRVTAARHRHSSAPPGAVRHDGSLWRWSRREHFEEKVQSRGGWINGGFFVFEPEVLSYIASPDTRLEAEPLVRSRGRPAN